MHVVLETELTDESENFGTAASEFIRVTDEQ